MQVTIALDDDLVARAQAFSDVQDVSSLVREALKSFVQQKDLAKRLDDLGGTMPDLVAPPRRRFGGDED